MIFSGLILEGCAIICFGLIDFVEDGTTYAILSAVCRMFEGVGNACIITSSYALVASHYPEEKENVIGTLQVFTGMGMMAGPLLGSVLYAIGGFQLPFYVPGGALLLLTIVTFFTLPEKENYAPDLRWSPNTGIMKKNELGYLECFANVRVVMIASIVMLTLLQLTFREPVLQFRLIDLGISPDYAGLFFALDLVGYIGVSVTLSNLPAEKKNLNLMVFLSMALAVIGLFFIGTIHFIGLQDCLWPLIIGIIINGTAGALCINNSVAAMINILNITYANRGELVNNIASAIFAFFFSCGEFFGPICGSVLTTQLGGFVNGITVINAVVLLVTILTTYHLAGEFLCGGDPGYTREHLVPGQEKMGRIHQNGYAELEEDGQDEFDITEQNQNLTKTSKDVELGKVDKSKDKYFKK